MVIGAAAGGPIGGAIAVGGVVASGGATVEPPRPRGRRKRARKTLVSPYFFSLLPAINDMVLLL